MRINNIKAYINKRKCSADNHFCKSRMEQVQVAINLINQCEADAENLGRLCEKYKTQLAEHPFTAFDFKATKIALEAIKNACDSKLDNIQFSFTITQSTDENIVIKYSSSQADKNKLRNCLSDGEKTALAFAYFLSKFENERETQEKRSKSIVVIDDPVSSLDANRLYSTAYLIRDNFKTAKQLIVLSHNFLFLKFFNSSYGGQTNCMFLNGDKLSELPEELRNFESPYFYMLKCVMEFADGTDSDSYQNAKKYLPNYIRRVLETFLSFKFAKIKKDSGSRSPGLNDFDKSIESLNIEDSIKQELKLKIKNIVKIADQHSHGNAQLTEENFYIAEDELKYLAQDVVTVIDIIDSVHKNNIIKPAMPKSTQSSGKN